jgi:hypothetical protein
MKTKIIVTESQYQRLFGKINVDDNKQVDSKNLNKDKSDSSENPKKSNKLKK